MKVAVLADVHGNLPALEAVMEDIDRTAPDYVVAAGDLALRGAWPRECVQLLHEKCHALLMGNTDSYIAGNYLGGAYRERDHWKSDLLEWTRAQLGEEWVTKLASLPFSARYAPRKGQDLFVCHANPRNLEESLDPTLDDRTVQRFFQHVDAAAVAFGHLHFPYRRKVGRMLIADVASAGIPRDGDLRPAWGLFSWTPRGWRVQIRRVRYSVKKATQGLQAKKVPGAPLLIHKMLECRYRHHAELAEAARRHSGLPPQASHFLKPSGGFPRVGETLSQAALPTSEQEAVLDATVPMEALIPPGLAEVPEAGEDATVPMPAFPAPEKG